MYRFAAILGAGLVLSACSSMPDYLKPKPAVDSVLFESDPPGAEARITNGPMCVTPCSMSVPVDAPLTVTFNLVGFEPLSETIEPVNSLMQPNPVQVALVRLAPVIVKPVRKSISKRLPAEKRAKAVERGPRAPASTAKPVRAPAPTAVRRPAPPAAPTISPPLPEPDAPSR